MPATVKMTFTKHLDRAAKSVRYYAFRSHEVPRAERGAFSRSSEHADIRRFTNGLRHSLTEDTRGRNGHVRQYPKMHRLLFSLSRDEFQKSGLTSWKPVVREVLAEWERAKGIRLEWIASEHPSPTHPHVHIAIKSVYRDLAGREHRLFVNRDTLNQLRIGVRMVVRRHREQHWRQIEEQRAIEREARAAEQNLQRAMEQAMRSLVRDLDRMAREEERPLEPQPRLRRRQPVRDDRDRGGR